MVIDLGSELFVIAYDLIELLLNSLQPVDLLLQLVKIVLVDHLLLHTYSQVVHLLNDEGRVNSSSTLCHFSHFFLCFVDRCALCSFCCFALINFDFLNVLLEIMVTVGDTGQGNL